MARKKKKLSITLKRSINKRLAAHKACVRGLGLRRIGHTVTIEMTPENYGMIKKVDYLLAIEEV